MRCLCFDWLNQGKRWKTIFGVKNSIAVWNKIKLQRIKDPAKKRIKDPVKKSDLKIFLRV